MTSEALRVSERESAGGHLVRTLTLSRPERRNALTPALLGSIVAALDETLSEPRVRVVIFAGEGRAFCAGYDLGTPFPAGDVVPDAVVEETMAAVRAFPLPTLARVQGPAYGAGLELALSCDVRVASPDASFCLPPARLGIAYAPGGLARLASLVGHSRARLMAFSARTLDASTALDWGLCDELSENLDESVARLADQMADAAPLAVQAMKRSFNALESRLSPSLEARALADRQACYDSADAREGVLAFTQKRPPKFEGR